MTRQRLLIRKRIQVHPDPFLGQDWLMSDHLLGPHRNHGLAETQLQDGRDA
jgi:hypothetical protein